MKSIIPFEDYLRVVRVFNIKYPGSHVGGSIGLMLHGVDLQRPLLNTDLDMTFKNPLPEVFEIENCKESSNPEDFDVQLRVLPEKDSSVYIKVEINVKQDSKFDVVEFGVYKYNVSKKEDILSWKKKYADKGVQKHIDDLITIETGVRPPEKVLETANDTIDDLPF